MVDSRFHDLDDLVWSFPVGSEFSGFPFLSVFEHLPEDQISQFEGAGLNLLIVIAFDLVLVVLDSKQCLLASFFDIIQCVEEHTLVKFDVLWHFGAS